MQASTQIIDEFRNKTHAAVLYKSKRGLYRVVYIELITFIHALRYRHYAPPANAEQINYAKRARKLGLDVEVPRPIMITPDITEEEFVKAVRNAQVHWYLKDDIIYHTVIIAGKKNGEAINILSRNKAGVYHLTLYSGGSDTPFPEKWMPIAWRKQLSEQNIRCNAERLALRKQREAEERRKLAKFFGVQE